MVALRRRYKLWAGGDDPDYLLEVENLRGTGGGIDLSIADLRAPESWPEEEGTLSLDLTIEEARDLVTVFAGSAGRDLGDAARRADRRLTRVRAGTSISSAS